MKDQKKDIELSNNSIESWCIEELRSLGFGGISDIDEFLKDHGIKLPNSDFIHSQN